MAGVAAGLHAVVLLPRGTDERALVAAAADDGVAVTGLTSMYRASEPPGPGLVLGYAALTEREIAEGIARLSTKVGASSPRTYGYSRAARRAQHDE